MFGFAINWSVVIVALATVLIILSTLFSLIIKELYFRR